MRTHITHKPGTSGFTLLETLVAGVITVVLGVMIITVLRLFSAETDEGIRRVKMQIAYDIVSEEIGRWVRVSNVVLGPGEAPCQTFTDTLSTREITCFLGPNRDTASFKIVTGEDGFDTLKEQRKPATEYKPFKIGNNPVLVTPASTFALNSNRKCVVLNLTVKAKGRKLTDTINVPAKGFLCRNYFYCPP